MQHMQCNSALIVLGCLRVILLFTPVGNNVGSFLEWKMDFSMANCGIPLPHKQFNSALEVILYFFSQNTGEHSASKESKYRIYFIIII